MKKRFIMTLPLILMWLCLNPALAQQPSPAPAQPAPRTPQLTSDDLETAPAPKPAEEVVPAAKVTPAPAPATRNASQSWVRHSYPDLGLSMEFSGNPPNPFAFQFQLPENPLADRNMKAQIFEGGAWNVLIIQGTLLLKPSAEELERLAAGFAKSFSIINPQYMPESGPNPTVRINGTITWENNEVRAFRGQLTAANNKLWIVASNCSTNAAQWCADVRHTLDSIKPAP